MMLPITPHQVDSLENTSFHEKIALMLAKSSSELQWLRSDEGKRAIDTQNQNAVAYGLDNLYDRARYIVTAWLLGPNFDRQIPFLHDILSDQTLVSKAKTDRLEAYVEALADTFEGS